MSITVWALVQCTLVCNVFWFPAGRVVRARSGEREGKNKKQNKGAAEVKWPAKEGEREHRARTIRPVWGCKETDRSILIIDIDSVLLLLLLSYNVTLILTWITKIKRTQHNDKHKKYSSRSENLTMQRKTKFTRSLPWQMKLTEWLWNDRTKSMTIYLFKVLRH